MESSEVDRILCLHPISANLAAGLSPAGRAKLLDQIVEKVGSLPREQVKDESFLPIWQELRKLFEKRKQ